MEVQFWWALVDDLEAHVAQGDAPLSEDDVARLRLLQFERDRREFLARRALERIVLSHHAPVRPRYNLSGSEGLVACVASTADVALGVDVENAEGPAPLEVAGSFAPSEVDTLRALSPEIRSRRFFDYWTLKEAYVKARGLGLTIPLDQCAFTVEPGAPIGVTFSPQLGDDAAWWEFRQLQPVGSYLAALAVRRPPGESVDLVVRRAP
jgi:4'-phosphopantetheinyl transferase